MAPEADHQPRATRSEGDRIGALRRPLIRITPGRHGGADEPVEVGHDVLEAALDVEARAGRHATQRQDPRAVFPAAPTRATGQHEPRARTVAGGSTSRWTASVDDEPRDDPAASHAVSPAPRGRSPRPPEAETSIAPRAGRCRKPQARPARRPIAPRIGEHVARHRRANASEVRPPHQRPSSTAITSTIRAERRAARRQRPVRRSNRRGPLPMGRRDRGARIHDKAAERELKKRRARRRPHGGFSPRSRPLLGSLDASAAHLAGRSTEGRRWSRSPPRRAARRAGSWGVGLATHSLGLISAGIESSGDVGGGRADLLRPFVLAGRPADRGHPYGHRPGGRISARLGEARDPDRRGALLVAGRGRSLTSSTAAHCS